MTYLRNRPRLFEVKSLDSKVYFVAPGQIEFKNNKFTKALPSGVLVHASFLNPSPNDIAFFQIAFHSDKRAIAAYTHLSTPLNSPSDSKFIYNFSDTANKTTELYFPKKPYGTFKACSYTSLDFFMPIKNGEPKLTSKTSLTFLYAIGKFPYFGINSRFRTMEIAIDTTNVYKNIDDEDKALKKLIKESSYEFKDIFSSKNQG